MPVIGVSEEEAKRNKEEGWEKLLNGDLLIFNSQLRSKMKVGDFSSTNYLFWRHVKDEIIEVVPLKNARSLAYVVDGEGPQELIHLEKSDLCQINQVI